MKTIDPCHEALHCPHCSSRDVRFEKDEQGWGCRQCRTKFLAINEGSRIRLKKEPRNGGSGAGRKNL